MVMTAFSTGGTGASPLCTFFSEFSLRATCSAAIVRRLAITIGPSAAGSRGGAPPLPAGSGSAIVREEVPGGSSNEP